MLEVTAILVVIAVVGGATFVIRRERRKEREIAIKHAVEDVGKILSGGASEEFNFFTYCRTRGLIGQASKQVAGKVFIHFHGKWIDQAITQTKLDDIARKIGLNVSEREEIKVRLGESHYRRIWQQLYSGGIPSHQALKKMLTEKRRLGIWRTTIGGHSVPLYQQVYRSWLTKALSDNYLNDFKDAIGMDAKSARGAERPESVRRITEEITAYLNARSITLAEFRALENRLLQFQLSPTDVDPSWTKLKRLIVLKTLREGTQFPSPRQVSISMHGDESCYFANQCQFFWITSKGQWKDATGELFLTDRRVIFASMEPNRSFDVGLFEVLDFAHTENGLRIRCTSAKGTGVFTGVDSEYLDALINGLKRSAPGPEGVRSRTISSRVKMAVWHRDGGRCVLCGSSLDIHYDHDVPFSKGGANTEENIRLLCATCNLKKRDRIE
jgi:hypothetical protein